jgi:hypothetical protein
MHTLEMAYQILVAARTRSTLEWMVSSRFKIRKLSVDFPRWQRPRYTSPYRQNCRKITMMSIVLLFYFDFHSARIIFDVSSGFYSWNINKITAWHLLKMLKFAFKDVSTKNSEPTYWTILFVMLKIYFIYKVAGKNFRCFF